MDLDEVDEWWLSSDNESNRSTWTLADELEEEERSVSDIFADTDSENDAKKQTISAQGSNKNVHHKKNDSRTESDIASDIASDTEHMELHVDSGDEPENVTLRLFQDGAQVGSATRCRRQVLQMLQHQPLKVTPIFANCPPLDKNGNLYLGKHHRLKSGTGSLREIRRYQRSTKPLIPKATFKRLIRQVRSELQVECSFAKDAYKALQEAAERYCVQIFNMANKLAIHSKRVTVQKKDLDMALEIMTKPWDVPGTNNGFSA